MGLLSNILGFLDARAGSEPPPLDVRVARADEVESAMRVVLAPPGQALADAAGVAEFVATSRARGVSFDGLHVAVRPVGAGGIEGKIVSAILPVISPGRTALLLGPAASHGKIADAGTRQLVDPVCAYAVGEGCVLAQALVDPHESGLEALYASRGFERMAELHYLQVAPPAEAAADAAEALPPGTRWVTYSEATHGDFAAAILDSYQQSLDCPALNGRREIGDVIAGHQAAGAFDSSLWFLLWDDAAGRALGVLLLGHGHRSDAMELVYLGLAPAARGRKLGAVMMRQALASVDGRGLGRLCLAVDARNTPALKLYYRHGMQRVGSKHALLRDLRG